MAELTDKEKEALKAAGDSTERIKELSSASKDAIKGVGDQITDSFSVLEKIQEWAKTAGDKIDSLGSIGGAAATEFGLLATSIAGARKQAEGFAGLDTSRLGSFTESTKTLFDIIRSSPGLGVASAAGKQLYSMLERLGVGAKDLTAALSMSGKELANFGEKILIGADNSLQFGSAIMEAAAKGGSSAQLLSGVGDAFGGIGEHLENLNVVISQFHNTMGAAMKATGIESVDQMNKFTASLLQAPGGLEAMVKGMDLAGEHTDSLTGIIRLAHGANLDIAQTFEDIRKSGSQFGMSVEDSTTLVARYVDVGKDLHAQQQDVRDAIIKTTGAFNLFAMNGVNATKMTQGLTDAVKNWASSLEKAGVPAQNALLLASKYTTQLKDMDEAQESFVSQQTGGPGGLLGALQFEDLMRTDPEAASAKMQEAIKTLLPSGKMVSKADSEKGGEAGASDYMQQRKILMSGQLGIKAGSKEEADAMIEAMIQGKAMPSGKTKEESLAETMEEGKKKEALAYSQFKEANITAEIVRLTAGDINLGTLENTLGTGGATGDDTGRGINIASQERLLRRKEESTGMDQTSGTSLAMSSVGGLINDLPMHMASILAAGKRSVTKESPNVPLPPQGSLPKTPINTTPHQGSLPKASSATGGLSPEEYQKQRQLLIFSGKAGSEEEAEAMMKALSSPVKSDADFGTAQPTKLDTDTESDNFGDYVPAGGQVRQSAAAASRTSDAATGTSARNPTGSSQQLGGGNAGGPIPVTLANGLTVNFTGLCPHCGRTSHQSAQAGIVSQASMASNKNSNTGIP